MDPSIFLFKRRMFKMKKLDLPSTCKQPYILSNTFILQLLAAAPIFILICLINFNNSGTLFKRSVLQPCICYIICNEISFTNLLTLIMISHHLKCIIKHVSNINISKDIGSSTSSFSIGPCTKCWLRNFPVTVNYFPLQCLFDYCLLYFQCSSGQVSLNLKVAILKVSSYVNFKWTDIGYLMNFMFEGLETLQNGNDVFWVATHI